MSPFDPHWDTRQPAPASVYSDAVWAAALLAVDPAGLGGMQLRSWNGPLRDMYVGNLSALFPSSARVRKVPLHVTDDRLFGGLDLTATLQAGKPVVARGLLADVAGGVLMLAMAERIGVGMAAKLAAAMDGGSGFAALALDEGSEDEAPPTVLLERLAFTVAALPGGDEPWPSREKILAARAMLAQVKAPDETIDQLCTIAAALGVGSARAAIFAVRAARAAACLRGGAMIEAEDIALAARLVLAPRATQMPAPPAPEQAEQQPEPAAEDRSEDETERGENDVPDETVADAVQTVLPPALLAMLAAGNGPRRLRRGAGTGGDLVSLKRGRPAGSRRSALEGDARLDLIETLRAAAPWQAIRKRPGSNGRIAVRSEDLRIKRFKEQAKTIAVFAVDASGSSAVNRLAEAKGAIQLLLADCYVRRDQVALLAFRGRDATCLLPPTNALARARRALAALPGGGPTPLATGIAAALEMAASERRKGHRPLLVLLTDGGANIGRDGKPGRAAAAADALAAGKACRGANIPTLVVDTAPRPQNFVAQLAAAMGGRYLALPYADAAGLSRAVQNQQRADGRIAA